MKPLNKNSRLLLTLTLFVCAMIGIAYASVPLYTIFCRATGLGGTTQRASVAPTETKNRYITVSFDSNVDPALPWDFGPLVKNVRVKLGEVTTIKYHARNNGDKTLTGTATFNIQPSKAGLYFEKIQCFCFTKQVLKPGQDLELPVKFFVDPALADDRENDDVTDITLSYTFFPAKDQGKADSTAGYVNETHINADDKTP
jgi:cytochrome c oxidase assembly protein subunit 11